MYILLLTLLIIDGIFLTVIVLLQAGQGGGLASMGGGAGTDNLIGGRQAVTLLTKSTWVSGGAFLGLALLLSILSSRQTGVGPVLRNTFQPAPATAPAPGGAVLPGTAPATTPGTAPAGTGTTPAPTTPAPATTTTGQ